MSVVFDMNGTQGINSFLEETEADEIIITGSDMNNIGRKPAFLGGQGPGNRQRYRQGSGASLGTGQGRM